MKVTERERELYVYSSSESALTDVSFSNGGEWNRQSAGVRHKCKACAGQVSVPGRLSYVAQNYRVPSVSFPRISHCCCSHTVVNAAST
jgi:hypothetical protein